MLRFSILLSLVIAALSAVAWKWGSLFNAISISVFPLTILVIVNGMRINLFSNNRLGIWCSTKGNAMALTGALFIPGRVTELLKPLYFKSKKGMPISQGTAVVVIERIFDVLGIAGLAICGLAILPVDEAAYLNTTRWFLVLSSGVLFLFVWLVLLQPSLAKKCIRFFPTEKLRIWIELHFNKVRAGFIAGLHPWQAFLTVLVWVGSWFCYWLFLQFDGGVSVSIEEALVIFIIGTLGLTVTATPGGIGTFEAAVGFALMKFGYDWDQAIFSAFGLRIAALLPNLVFTAYTVFIEGFDLLKFRRETPGNTEGQ